MTQFWIKLQISLYVLAWGRKVKAQWLRYGTDNYMQSVVFLYVI